MIMRCLPDKVLRTLSGFDFWNYGFSEISSLFFDLGFYFSEKWYIVIKKKSNDSYIVNCNSRCVISEYYEVKNERKV